MKEAITINITQGEAGFKQRHWSGTPPGHATACHMSHVASHVTQPGNSVRGRRLWESLNIRKNKTSSVRGN